MAEGSGKQSCSTEDQGTSPWTNNPLTTGLQGGPKCTVLGVIMSWVFPMDTSWVSQEPVPRASQQKGVQNHLLSTLTLLYLVSISRHAREEVRASHYSQVPQDKSNICQDYS